MYQIYGLSISANTTKTVFVAEALGVDYAYIPVDLSKGEHKTPEHLQRHPLGKLPALNHNGKTLFESNAICTYLCNCEPSDLYPTDNYNRALVDQWLAFFTNHLGRWLNVYAFEKVAKQKYGFGEPNKEAEEEAYGYIQQQIPVINNTLNNGYFTESLSIADYVAFAYFKNAEMAELPLQDFPAIEQWYNKLKSSEVIASAHKKMGLVD